LLDCRDPETKAALEAEVQWRSLTLGVGERPELYP